MNEIKCDEVLDLNMQEGEVQSERESEKGAGVDF